MRRAWDKFFVQILGDEKEARRVAAMVRRGCGPVAKVTNAALDKIIVERALDETELKVIRHLQTALVDH